MKKKKIKIVAIIMVFCMLSQTIVYAQEGETKTIADEMETLISERAATVMTEMNEILSKEKPAQEQYANLISELHTTISSINASGVSKQRGKETLNDYYGGAYLNKDKKLTVCVTDDSQDIKESIAQTVGTQEIEIRKVNHTWDEINEIATSLQEKIEYYQNNVRLEEKEYLLILDIVGIYADVFTNKVIVSISKLNNDKEQMFWSLFNEFKSDTIELVEGERAELTVTIKPGGGLYKTASASTSGQLASQSVGYRGYRINSSGNTVYGFTGCGHGAASELYRGGEKVGTRYDYAVGGNYDIAFYDKTSSTTTSNQTSYSDDVGSSNETVSLSTTAPPTSQSILLGSTVMKVGSASFFTLGEILSVNTNYRISNVNFTNLMQTTALNLGGDSGGAAFIYYGGSYRIVGTMTGSSYSGTSLTSNTFTYSFIAQYRYAVNALNSTIYRH